MAVHVWNLGVEHLAHLCLYIFNINYCNILFNLLQLSPSQINQLFVQAEHKNYQSIGIILGDQLNQNKGKDIKIQMSSQLQKSIKVTLSLITKALKQMPKDKQPMILSSVNQILNKYTGMQAIPSNFKNGNSPSRPKQPSVELSEDQLKKFYKQLDFRLNFIKLCYPNLDFTLEETANDPKKAEQPANQQKQGGQKQQKQYDHNTTLSSHNSDFEIERLNKQDIFDQQQKRQKSVRQQVEFSNWFEGNTDPDVLKRHKQLLQRQHFQGQFWKDKKVPESYAKQYLRQTIEQKKSEVSEIPKKDQILEDSGPRVYQQDNENWKKVQR